MTAKVKKPVVWMGSSRDDLRGFPSDVRCVMAFAILLAQLGDKHPDAKPLKGFGHAGVLEIVDDFDGDTYRAIYTVRLEGIVYMLHAFQKKSKKGIATSRSDVELIKSRLKAAEAHHENSRRKEK